MTHKELFEKLIYDENVSENIDVCDEYEKDKYGNSRMTLSFEGMDDGRKKGYNGMIVLLFNPKGRLLTMTIATARKGKDDWQIAYSGPFDDFKHYITKVEQ